MKATFRESLSLAKNLLKVQWLVLGILFIVGCIININLENAIHEATPAAENQRWIIQLTLGLWELTEGILLMLILSWGIPEVRQFPKDGPLMNDPFKTPYLGSFFAEYLRALAKVLMWGLLLILPGFYKYFQLIFVPLIAIFSKSYRANEQDALRLSERLSKGWVLKIFYIVLFTTILSGVFEYLPQMMPELHSAEFRVLFSSVGFLISIWTYSLIFLIFERRMREVSLEAEK